MNLREVRQAAKQHIWHPSVVEMSNYILDTIDPEPDLPITAEWLREEWGAVDGRMPGDLVIGPIVRGINKEIGKPYWMVRSWTITHDLTTRQQFCDLARCLGIPRRPSKSEPGCTCLDSPNMLYAPCSYCEQRRKDGAK